MDCCVRIRVKEMQVLHYRAVVRQRLRPRLEYIRLTLRNVLLLLKRWRALVDAYITVIRCGYFRRIGCLLVDHNEAQILA